MEKRVFGVVLTILGIIGLIMAAVNFVHGAAGNTAVKTLAVYGVLGLLFFFSGIGLIRSSSDVLKSNERIS